MDQAKLGDRVNCRCKGGPHHLVSGASTVFVDGVPAARVGDRSSCGATVVSGLDWYLVEGASAAIRGSVTSCGGQIVANASATTGSPAGAWSEPARVAAASLAGSGGTGAGSADRLSTRLASSANTNVASPSNQNSLQHNTDYALADGGESQAPEQGVAPGFVIARRLTSRTALKRELLPLPTAEVDAMFERLNGHLGDIVLPGSMVVLSDPANQQCHAEEEALMQEARQIAQTVHRLEPPQAQAMVDHWGAFEDIALLREVMEEDASLASASTLMGMVSAAGQNLFTKTQIELDNLAALYQRTLDPTISQSHEQFRALREAAFQRIDATVPAWLRRPLNLPADAQALKHRIGVEVGQAVHSLNTAREGFRQFEIPTVSEAVARVGLVSRLTSIGSAVGVGLDAMATQGNIAEACTTGREEECQRIQYVEYGRLIGRTVGGTVGGGAAIARNACLIVSLDARGRLVCGMVGAGAGAFGGAKVVEPLGERLGLLLYQTVDDGNSYESD